ncbi:MAG: shikimate dehydrogenase [Candidatus Krumholzibacteria bacterium]|jgi:shikimate dehydrogenase|nr:shikimate dehydrogenase [Candidatus Krumholzibacteria bacterium]MDP6669774.1 shikimate dehydrogenase [Candidatus Krumholzibacteria bacterium]MDP6797499.1 shikimate dehydrogenase [Candidatus Krumholzibacteria bacterium]MDP7021157.1 shikimate dehydrogenase [Candidatus Krumholzibacteria bacterium]
MTSFWLLGLLGDPVEHSRSPAMQEAALKSSGLQGEYRKIHCSAASLKETLDRLLGEGYRGLNLTVPLKEEGFRLLDKLSDEAGLLGAVNTLRPSGSSWEGHNGDFHGFRSALAENYGSLRGKQALLIGAGGAARAAFRVLVEEGAESVRILNRTPKRAEALIESLMPADSSCSVGLADNVPGDCDLVIQATSLGLHNDDPLPPLPPRPVFCMDLLSHETPWQLACREMGCKVVDGRSMLLYQGHEAFRFWTGLRAPLSDMAQSLGLLSPGE